MNIVVKDLAVQVPSNFEDRIPLFCRHLTVYFYLQQFAVDRTVLDVGCGYGYGSYILSAKAKEVIGVDSSPERIEAAKKTYTKTNLDFLVLDGFKIEEHFKDEKIDVITAMEFIEHIHQPQEFLKIAYKLLTPGGCMILSTPNRRFRLRAEEDRPWNPEHIQEFDKDTLFSLVSNSPFSNIEIKGVSGNSEALEYEIKRTGGKTFAFLKPMWRYLPEILKIPVRKVINIGLPKELGSDDYFVVDEIDDSTFGFLLLASKKS